MKVIWPESSSCLVSASVHPWIPFQNILEVDRHWKPTLPYFPESPGSRAENASSSRLSHKLPGDACCACARLTDQSPLSQPIRPADLEGLSPITTGLGWDFRYHIRLTHHHLSSGRQEEWISQTLGSSTFKQKLRKGKQAGSHSGKSQKTKTAP